MAQEHRMTGAQAIVASLEAEGVEYVFGYPGGNVLGIYDALYDSSIQHVLVRHEQAAVHAADGYARSSGRPGIVLVTSGPGATNTVTGIATAFMDSIPLVVITGQVETGIIGTDAFQEADITGITLPITKHSYLVKDVRDLPRVIKEAFYIATTGRPGPVLIDVPCDVQAATFDFWYPLTVNLPSYKPTLRGNKRQITAAAALIARAKRPVLYVGGGIIASDASGELMELAESMSIPVAVTLMGKGCFPAEHQLYLGMPGMHGGIHVNMALEQADLLIAVGVRFADRVAGKLADLARSTKVIHIDIDPAEIGKNQEVDVPIVGDARGILAGLIEELRKMGAQPHCQDWLQQLAVWQREHAIPCAHRGDAIDPAAFMCDLARMLQQRDDDFIICTEVGQHQMWAAQKLPINRPRAFITSGGLGTMGFGLPAAMGAQIANPESKLLCISGDGSLQMNIQEMATIRSLGLPLKVIVLDNAALGMVRQFQELFYQQRYSATLFDESPDFVAIARAYGWAAACISTPSQIRAALEWLLSYDGPALLTVRIPQDALVLPMVPTGATVDDVIIARPEHDGREAEL
ncbi:MAG: biosynthetic-type acetolactate synthase large subunit [Coriobacteriales bacterium]|nr:biosynthetic-type acetolactate synthase large subunit [Coriobacteriales bacterium]